MDNKVEPEKLFKFIWGELEASTQAIDNGGEVNMANLDKNVREFCNIVTNLPPAEAKKYDEKIDSIVKYLTDLITKLSERKVDIGEQIDHATYRNKAQSAYGAAMRHSLNEAE